MTTEKSKRPMTPAQLQRNRDLQVLRDVRRRERAAADRAQAQQLAQAEAKVQRRHDRDPAVRVYRAEKAKADARKANAMAEVKAKLDALAESGRQPFRVGDPLRRMGAMPKRSDVDPADALVKSLNPYYGERAS